MVRIFGSSPRVRGTVWQRSWHGCGLRFIPACAGNSVHTAAGNNKRSVHPRVCGEQSIGRNLTLWNSGSSPRVRGTGQTRSSTMTLFRFIPACAGNRGQRRRTFYRCAVHPRVCGEQLAAHWLAVTEYGSSPRVRGTEAISTSAGETDRFIPACAGNSKVRLIELAVKTVHPRVCGEQRFW